MNDSSLIINAVRGAVSNCVKFGGQPNELWLGPREYAEMRVFVNNFFQLGRRDDGSPSGEEYFDGMRVRIMLESGWRVGRTFTP